MKKIFILTFIFYLILNNLFPKEPLIHEFNYSNSRLKKINLYSQNKLKLYSNIEYKYDENGYLIGRKIGESIYSYIEYNLKENKIKETWNRIFDKKNIPVIFDYIYDNKDQLIEYKRFDGNVYDSEINYSGSIYFDYNEKGDIIKSYYNKANYNSVYLPGNGFVRNGSATKNPEKDITEYYYKYEKNKTTQFCKYYRENKIVDIILNEYFFDDENKLIKLNKYKYYGNELFYKVMYIYDKNNLIKETIILTIYDNDSQKILYDYDKKNRLIRKTTYYNDKIAKNKISYIEEFIYEEASFKYKPYLLPNKIVVNPGNEYQMSFNIDKFIF